MDKQQNKIKIRQLVETLRTQDPELFEYLRRTVNAEDTRIDKIEKYLGLDYKLDGINPKETNYSEIDYSFIPRENIQNQLISDFREMLRYRYGTRSHKADFYEFCRYAHFQLEALLNEFLRISCIEDGKLNDDKVKEYINKKDSEYKSIEEIPYTLKLSPVLSKLELSSFKDNIISSQNKEGIRIQYGFGNVIRYISYVRNDCNHRGDIIDKQKEVEKFFKDPKYKEIQYDGGTSIRYYDFSSESGKKVQYYLWLLSTPWDDVIMTMVIFIRKIKENLNNNKF